MRYVPSRASLAGMMVVLLAAVAAGLWPEAIYQRPDIPSGPTLKLLRALLVGQGVFFLLIWPACLLGQARRGMSIGIIQAVTRAAMLLAIAAPVYVMSVFLSDATFADLLRGVLSVGAVIPLGYVAACYFIRWRASTPVVLLVLLLGTLAFPAGLYAVHEFVLPSGPIPPAAAYAGPVTFLWHQADGALTAVTPTPGIIPIAYLCIAFLAFMALIVIKPTTGKPQQ